jgi:hypothetical protein
MSKIKIRGAEYAAFDSEDGYYTVKDVVLMGQIRKGVKGAPRDYKARELQEIVDRSQMLYQKGKYAAPAHLGHHEDLKPTPEHIGFVLPKRVGRAIIEGEEQDAIIGDVKLKADAFERAQRGEMPYLSPEIVWEKNQLRSIAFLSSQPPYFKAPLFTTREPVRDLAACFSAVPMDEFRDKPMSEIPDGHYKPYTELVGVMERAGLKGEQAVLAAGEAWQWSKSPDRTADPAINLADAKKHIADAKKEADEKQLFTNKHNGLFF